MVDDIDGWDKKISIIEVTLGEARCDTDWYRKRVDEFQVSRYNYAISEHFFNIFTDDFTTKLSHVTGEHSSN